MEDAGGQQPRGARLALLRQNAASVPTPPEAITGTRTAPQTARSRSRSKPTPVPSRSMLVSRISPAPSAATCAHQAIASMPGVVPAAMGEHLPTAAGRLLRIDRHHHALAAELSGRLRAPAQDGRRRPN